MDESDTNFEHWLIVAMAETEYGLDVMDALTARNYPAGTTDCRSEHQSAFTSALGNGPTLFDLTAIHPLLHEGPLDPPPRPGRLLWAFDAVVLVPNAQPSSLIVPITERR